MDHLPVPVSMAANDLFGNPGIDVSSGSRSWKISATVRHRASPSASGFRHGEAWFPLTLTRSFAAFASDQRDREKRKPLSERRRVCPNLLVQAERRDLSAFTACTCSKSPPGSVCRRGPYRRTPLPKEHAGGVRDRARQQPRSVLGRCGAEPCRRGSRRQRSDSRLRGKPSPFSSVIWASMPLSKVRTRTSCPALYRSISIAQPPSVASTACDKAVLRPRTPT